MFSLIKFLVTFAFTFVILGFPYKNKPLFYYLENKARPYTQEIYKKVGVKINGVLNKTTDLTQEYFFEGGEGQKNVAGNDKNTDDDLQFEEYYAGDDTQEEYDEVNAKQSSRLKKQSLFNMAYNKAKRKGQTIHLKRKEDLPEGRTDEEMQKLRELIKNSQ